MISIASNRESFTTFFMVGFRKKKKDNNKNKFENGNDVFTQEQLHSWKQQHCNSSSVSSSESLIKLKFVGKVFRELDQIKVCR